MIVLWSLLSEEDGEPEAPPEVPPDPVPGDGSAILKLYAAGEYRAVTLRALVDGQYLAVSIYPGP